MILKREDSFKRLYELIHVIQWHFLRFLKTTFQQYSCNILCNAKHINCKLQDPSVCFVISSDFCHWGDRFRYTYHDKNAGEIHQSIKVNYEEGKSFPISFISFSLRNCNMILTYIVENNKLSSIQSVPRKMNCLLLHYSFFCRH